MVDFSRLDYVQNVLGVKKVLQPESVQRTYRIYGSLDQDYLLLFCEKYNPERRQLISKMMKALNVSTYTCSFVKNLQFDLIYNLILRSSAKKIIFFGPEWKLFCQKQFHQEICLNQVFSFSKCLLKGFWTYSLSEFLGDSEVIRQKKRETFQGLKVLRSNSGG